VAVVSMRLSGRRDLVMELNGPWLMTDTFGVVVVWF
jgi:hypothetical protein